MILLVGLPARWQANCGPVGRPTGGGLSDVPGSWPCGCVGGCAAGQACQLELQMGTDLLRRGGILQGRISHLDEVG